MASLECKIIYNKKDAESAAKILGFKDSKKMMESAFKNQSLSASKGTSFELVYHYIFEDKKCELFGIVETDDKEVIEKYNLEMKHKS